MPDLPRWYQNFTNLVYVEWKLRNPKKGKLSDGSSVTQFKNDIHIDVPTVDGKFKDNWVKINNTVLPERSVVDIRNNYTVALRPIHTSEKKSAIFVSMFRLVVNKLLLLLSKRYFFFDF